MGGGIHQNIDGETLDIADLELQTNAITQENGIRSLKLGTLNDVRNLNIRKRKATLALF
jgi:hypothetical protein